MQIDTIDGSKWGFDAGMYIGMEFSTERGVRGGEVDACIFITNGPSEDEPPDLNVFIALEDEDRDSTDVNPFRQYARPIKDVLSDITKIEGFAAAFHNSAINSIDRELVRTFGFTRII